MSVAVTVGLVAAAGAVGAPARYAIEVSTRAHRPTITPLGTLAVNVSGSLALGILVGLVLAHGVSADVRTVVGTGFLGAYTTFSTYAYETVRRLEDGHARVALAYAVGSLVASTLAAAIGIAATGAW
ncbi:MAG: putative fluoride ion transporter CrcB [Acidimicrobiia bacterium]